MDEIVMEQHLAAVDARAKEVRSSLQKLNSFIEDSFFDICDLLCEAQAGAYQRVFGFERFGDWVEAGSGLDLSSRQAFYMINISKKAKDLGLTREQLKAVKISKLKEIFSLEIAEHGAEIKKLLEGAPGMSLEEVCIHVRTLKGQEESTFITLKLEKSVKKTVDRAFELARRNYGDTMQNGEATDISTSKCMEIVCVDYLQDPNNSFEGQSIAEEQEP